MAFSETLKYLREEKQITQKELAAACKLSPQCICALEQGTRNPTGSTVAVLAQFFEVSADYLLGLEDDFGARAAAPMHSAHSSEETRLLEIYRKLSPEMQSTLWSLLETWNPSTTRKNKV